MASKIYRWQKRIFSRDERDFCGQSIGVPVYYITSVADIKNIDEAEKTVIIPLIDIKLILDKGFKNYVDILCCIPDQNSNYIVFPVSFINVINIPADMPNLKKNQCIRLYNVGTLSENKFFEKLKALRFDLTHEICRLLRGREMSNVAEGLKPSVKIFVSHAGEDGRELSKKISDYIQTQTGLKSFIDVNDIPCGSNFEKNIEGNVKSSILAILLTDKYSTMEWCQRELICAKRNGCPIVLLDALANGEARRFPYSANVKTVHLGHDDTFSENRIKDVLFEVMIETVRIRYNELYLSYINKLYNQKEIRVFSITPELFSLLSLNINDKVVLYPDPAINYVELDILKKCRPDCLFITPTLLPSCQNINKNFLNQKDIGISISDINILGDIARTNTHLASFYIELCRYLLAEGVNLCYAGNINYKSDFNFVELLKQLTNNYCFDYNINKHIKWYYLEGELTEEQQIEAENNFELIEIPKLIDVFDNEETERNLTELRKYACEGNYAQIIVGGKTSNYKGRYPGVIEEALLAIEKDIPIYVVVAYGGAAELAVLWLNGYESENSLLNTVSQKFKEIGMKNLNNGLTEGENIELGNCIDIPRTIALILKGLSNLE